MALYSKPTSLRGSRRRSSRRPRWPWVAFGVYLTVLCTVLGVLAEQRWGWLPVRARAQHGQADDALPLGGLPAPNPEPMSSRWSEKAVARGWEAGSLHAGFIPAPATDVSPDASMAGASGLPQPAWRGSLEAFGPRVGDLKVLNLDPPDFSGLKRR